MRMLKKLLLICLTVLPVVACGDTINMLAPQDTELAYFDVGVGRQFQLAEIETPVTGPDEPMPKFFVQMKEGGLATPVLEFTVKTQVYENGPYLWRYTAIFLAVKPGLETFITKTTSRPDTWTQKVLIGYGKG